MFADARAALVEWLRAQLIGPAGDEDEVLRIANSRTPSYRYPTGVLHSIDPGRSGVDAVNGPDTTADDGLLDDDGADEREDPDEDKQAAQPARRRRYVPPSAVGFSFFVRGAVSLRITASAAIYVQQGERDAQGRFILREFRREPLSAFSCTWTESSSPLPPIWEGRAGLEVRNRKHRDGTMLTVTLFNQQLLDSSRQGREEKALFQVGLHCTIASGQLVEYPRVSPSLLTEEEQELELQYRERRIYAVGHGAAVAWRAGPQVQPELWVDFMPTVETPMVSADGGDHATLTLDRLASTPRTEELEAFVMAYARWIEEQRSAASNLHGRGDHAAAARVLERMATALQRMRTCIAMLRSDPMALEAFRLANKAMRDQMRQADLRLGGHDSGKDDRPFRWRPFQLAFLLTVMESAIREDDEFRDVLDLIWFPTGGGKTEAYLGLIAFLVVWRRLKYGREGAGTVAFMRYTLRLLTRQQFERAARMICALELMRREDPRLGTEAISVGIWVGGQSTPNTYDQAGQAVDAIEAGGRLGHHALVMDRCPWCATPFGSHDTSYDATPTSFAFYCCNSDCAYGASDEQLPCNVVDEALYEDPPTLLIATIDKFARVAWDGRASAFFGVAGHRPPELVIQDELHLITGPLGSVAGIYETGFDTLLAERGSRPKYVASTATIRMAEQQVRALYARETAVFPPPGLSCDDTFFARVDRTRPGRLYMGYLAPLLDQQHCLAPLAAALLLGPEANFVSDVDEDVLLDAWWTQVLYHSSLRGVANSDNAFATDVRDFVRVFGEQAASEVNGTLSDDASPRGIARRQVDVPRTAQLTSRRSAEENADTFHRLQADRKDAGCLDAVLATNMISVGLDVSRLALMVINGQPLTTAEYIQASSRVGRDEVPGLVVANYYRHQARSLSHYENFRAYHDSFYRFVEPSSVTPFTYQVRTRALHAALAIAVRHACDHLLANTSAGDFRSDDPRVCQVIERLKARCKRANPEDPEAVARHIDQLADEWHKEAARCRETRRQLKYQERDGIANADRLLYGHGDTTPGVWKTLHSMRNVESEGRLRLNE